MYKVLMADDEGIVTDSLQFILNRYFKDMCVVQVARTGRQAIDLTEEFKPDIIFMDIQMPGINGLDAMEEIRSHNPKTHIVILTAYDNFEYARKAMKLGAATYMLKPINTQEVLSQLSSIMRQVDMEQRSRQDKLDIREKMDMAMPLIEDSFVSALMYGSCSKEDERRYRSILDFSEEYAVAMVVCWNDDASHMPPSQDALGAFSPVDRIVEIVRASFRACIGTPSAHRLICVVPMDTKSGPPSPAWNTLSGKAQHVLQSLEKLHGAVRIAFGSVVPWQEVGESCSEAFGALYSSQSSVAFYAPLPEDVAPVPPLCAADGLALLEAVRLGDSDALRREAMVFISLLKKLSGKGEARVRLGLLEIMLQARRLVQEPGGMLANGEIAGIPVDFMEGRFVDANMENTFITFMTACAQAVPGNRKPPSSALMEKAMAYMKEHFVEDIALETVAREIGVSPYYFSKLFKEQTGRNYSEYLTSLRINAARCLLENPGLSIKQVCLEVGYSDPNYFSRTFRRCVGVSPTEYREALDIPL